jgi:hypothetical protein
MGTNAIALIGLALQAMQQAQTYQLAVAKAAAEGRDVTDEEVAAAKAAALAAVDMLAKS